MKTMNEQLAEVNDRAANIHDATSLQAGASIYAKQLPRTIPGKLLAEEKAAFIVNKEIIRQM